LDAAADAARHAADSGVERQATVSRAAAELRALAHNAAAEETALAPLRRDAERVRTLAEVCRGTGNHRRMSLERFVLAAVLEDVAARASLRLAAMTDGRFTLRHSDERTRGGGASGLSILVSDAFTGTERDVATLSGGETFQASLALALGIADAVAGTGAVPLSALFVDEGFGMLDPDALEQALTELDRLREGGRLVGVISHVAAMRERIPAGLRVERTRGGSRVLPADAELMEAAATSD
jgi:exonuclease SbcC